jgi:hypothetical protein
MLYRTAYCGALNGEGRVCIKFSEKDCARGGAEEQAFAHLRLRISA